MSMTNFTPRGVYPALPTPIAEDGSINFEAAENHIEYLEENDVHGIVPAGCTGHAAALGDRGGDDLEYGEHVEYVERISEMTDLPVIAGTGMNTTRQTIQLGQKVEEAADIDAHLVISPYQNCPPQDLIVDHYREVAEELEEDIIAYNVPGRTGRNIDAETALELAEIDGVVGLKEASLDHGQIHEIGMELQRQGIDDFYLGSGDDGANPFVYQQGGDFAISVSANVAPSESVEVWREAVENGDIVESYDQNQELQPLHDAMFQEGEKNPISVMYALNEMGFAYGTPRMPLDREPRQDDEFQNREEIEEVLDMLEVS